MEVLGGSSIESSRLVHVTMPTFHGRNRAGSFGGGTRFSKNLVVEGCIDARTIHRPETILLETQ